MPQVGSGFDALRPTERAKIPIKVNMGRSYRPVETRRGQIQGPGDCALYSNSTNGTFGIFDGGIYGGVDRKIAADTAGDSVDADLKDLPAGIKHGRAADIVHGALVDAGKKLMGKGISVSAAAGVGVISRDEYSGGPVATIGYAGNVEFRLLSNGVLRQLNLPDTSVRHIKGTQEDKMALQRRLSDAKTPAELTSDEQQHFKAGDEVYIALGSPKLSPHIEHYSLRPGDRLLVINHGISHALTNREIQDILSKTPNPNEAIAALTEAAIKRSFGDDGSFRAGLADMAGLVVDIPMDWADKRANQIPQHGVNSAGRRPLAQPVEPTRRAEASQQVNQFQVNALVFVDKQWFSVTGRDAQGKVRMVPYGQPPQGGMRIVEKYLSAQDLIAGGNNPMSLKERLATAATPEDAVAAINWFAGVQGKQDYFPREELIKIAREVADGKRPTSDLPRTDDVRTTFIRFADRGH